MRSFSHSTDASATTDKKASSRLKQLARTKSDDGASLEFVAAGALTAPPQLLENHTQ
jgi:hypothetical protein